eukprot:6292536-Karenia_brevis.AAC.1
MGGRLQRATLRERSQDFDALTSASGATADTSQPLREDACSGNVGSSCAIGVSRRPLKCCRPFSKKSLRDSRSQSSSSIPASLKLLLFVEVSSGCG